MFMDQNWSTDLTIITKRRYFFLQGRESVLSKLGSFRIFSPAAFPHHPPSHPHETSGTAPPPTSSSSPSPAGFHVITLCWLSGCLVGPFAGSPFPARLLSVAGANFCLSQLLSSLPGQLPTPVRTKVCISGPAAPLSSGFAHTVAPWTSTPASYLRWPKCHPRCPPPN